MARRIQWGMLAARLYVELGGRNDCVVRFLPLLIVTQSEVEEITGRFREVVEATEQASISEARS